MKIILNDKELVPDESWVRVWTMMKHPDGYIKFEFNLPPHLLHWFDERGNRYLGRFAGNIFEAVQEAIEEYKDGIQDYASR